VRCRPRSSQRTFGEPENLQAGEWAFALQAKDWSAWESGARLEHADPLPDLAQTVELVEARDSGADDDGVEVQLPSGRGAGLLLGWGRHRSYLTQPTDSIAGDLRTLKRQIEFPSGP
jgi:hypothetical protein